MKFWGDGKSAGSGIEREDKGKSLDEFVDDYTVIDIESTGLDPWEDRLIEVAAVRFRAREQVAEYETLINPQRPIDSEIVEITGINDDMVSNAPFFEDIKDELRAFLGTDILVGHNINFDVSFLYEKFYELDDEGITNDYIDTLKWGRRLLPQLEQHRLEDITKELNIVNPGAHRALNDVLTTQKVYEELRQIELGDEEDDIQLGLF